MNEKEAIERATAEAFIDLYNSKMGTSYAINEHSDAPDVGCRDANGNSLNLEITLTEDNPGDIQALLGRSDHKSLDALKKHNEAVKQGKVSALDGMSCLQGNVTSMIAQRIRSKLTKDYGPNTALVIRDSSAVGWDWDLVVDQIRGVVNLAKNPYDQSIWIISYSKDRIFRLV